MTRIGTTLTCTLIALLMTVSTSPQAQAQSEQEAKIGGPDVVLYVEGMVCSMCARRMTGQLEELDAVKDAEALLEEEQRVLLTLTEGATVTEEALREAVTSAGFSTLEVEFEAGDDRSQSSRDDSAGTAGNAAVQMVNGVQVVTITASDRGYEPAMPTFPIGRQKVGLSPILQITALPAASVFLAATFPL